MTRGEEQDGCEKRFDVWFGTVANNLREGSSTSGPQAATEPWIISL